MARRHLFAIVVLLAAATVAGLVALTRTVQLGPGATRASDAQVAARSRSLDRLEASLRRSLAERPPALPTAAAAVAAAPRLAGGGHEDDDEEHEDFDD